MPGQDVAGVVVRRAADGSGPDVGTRVAGLAEWHGWAERVPVPTNRIAVLPDGVTDVQAAALPMAGTTAANVLREGPPLLGARVLVTGASGGVGRFAVQLAALGGATVDGGVDSDQARRATSYHLILESAGGASLAAAVDTVAHGGRIVVFGNSAGEPGEVDFRTFAGREARSSRTSPPGTSTRPERTWRRCLQLVADGRLRVEIGLEASWAGAPTTSRRAGGPPRTGQGRPAWWTSGASPRRRSRPRNRPRRTAQRRRESPDCPAPRCPPDEPRRQPVEVGDGEMTLCVMAADPFASTTPGRPRHQASAAIDPKLEVTEANHPCRRR